MSGMRSRFIAGKEYWEIGGKLFKKHSGRVKLSHERQSDAITRAIDINTARNNRATIDILHSINAKKKPGEF